MISHSARVDDLIRLSFVGDIMLVRLRCLVGHVIRSGVVVTAPVDLTVFWVMMIIIVLFTLDYWMLVHLFMVVVVIIMIVLLVFMQEVMAPISSKVMVMLYSRMVSCLFELRSELDLLRVSEVHRIGLSSAVVVTWLGMMRFVAPLLLIINGGRPEAPILPFSESSRSPNIWVSRLCPS